MIYILQIVFIVFAFFICRRESNKFKKAILDQFYDFGIYKLNPLHGKSAVKKAKLGLLLSLILPWLLVVVFLIYNLRSYGFS